MTREVYLDCAASAPIAPEVLDYLIAQYKRNLGNSASIHRAGVRAAVELEQARMQIAQKIGSNTDEIYFTSGATESNNLALKGLIEKYKTLDCNEIIISTMEHSSISQVAKQLANQGCVIRQVPVDLQGFVIVEDLKKMISSRTLLVSVVHANSEIGVVQNIAEIGRLCADKDVFFHSDGAQAFCKTPVDVREMNLDMYSMSAHKIHGPRGIGAIYVSDNLQLSPQIVGGGQEQNIRSGTVAVELACAMGKAVQLYTETSLKDLMDLQSYLLKCLYETYPNIRYHGSLKSRLLNQVNFAIPGFSGKSILKELDQIGVYISVGSACDSGKKNASATLKAIGLTDDDAFEALRVSWGLQTSREDLDIFLSALKGIIHRKSEIRYG